MTVIAPEARSRRMSGRASPQRRQSIGIGCRLSKRIARTARSAPVEGVHELFGFLTTEANAIVAPVHPKAMPVILATPAEVDLWLDAETVDALALQRPLPDDVLEAVGAKGEKEDRGVAEPA